MIFSSSTGSRMTGTRVGPDFLHARSTGKHYDKFDEPDGGCSGDCNDCPVLECDNNARNEDKTNAEEGSDAE